ANIEDLVALPARHSFVDALAALIASASTGSLAKLIGGSHDKGPRIEVSAFTRAIRGRIQIAGLPNGLTASVVYAPATDMKPGRAMQARPGRAARAEGPPGDLEQSRRVTERPIFSIARLLSPENRTEQSLQLRRRRGDAD